MEVKVLIDASEYKNLKEIEKLYFKQKDKDEESENSTKATSKIQKGEGYQPFGEFQETEKTEDEHSRDLDKIVEKVFEKLQKRKAPESFEEKVSEMPLPYPEKVQVLENSNLENLLQKFNKRERKKANIILMALKKSPDFQLDNHQITIKETFYPDSDIVKLIKFALSPSRSGKTLIGKNDFLDFLEEKGLNHFVKQKKYDPQIDIDKANEQERRKEIKEEEKIDKFWYCLA